MVAIATGLWWDYSRPAVQAATLTLPADLGNVLLSGLTVLVTVAGASFWNVAAFVLHSQLVRMDGEPVGALSLQHRVTLRNSSSPIGTAWKAIKIYQAWYSTRSPRLLVRTLAVVVPALIIWASFAAAAVFVSRVASRANGVVVARVQPENCGVWQFDTSYVEGIAAARTKKANDTALARTYVSNFYANTTISSIARSIFVQPTLAYTTNPAAPCPIPAAELCIWGPNAAFSMTTAMLDSQQMLGVNARAQDRVSVQISATCSQVKTRDYRRANDTHEIFTFGGLLGSAVDNITYTYYLGTEFTKIGYMLAPIIGNNGRSSLWAPIPEFNRTDADMSIFFLSQNAVTYLSPVYDLFFSANGMRNKTLGGQTLFLPDAYVNVMVCAEQYVVCNPSTSSCTAPGGWEHLSDGILNKNTPGFNAAQISTAWRILMALVDSNMYSSVEGADAGALWAKNLVTMNISPGLPDNQWQIEVLGWFQTILARVQAYMIDYASSTAGLSSFGTSESLYNNRLTFGDESDESDESDAMLPSQCESQLVRTAGDVQNFNFAGVMIIACISVFLVVLDCALGSIVKFVTRYLPFRSVAETARQADDNLHLLRTALKSSDEDGGRNGWRPGRWDVPVLDGDVSLMGLPLKDPSSTTP